MAITTQEILAEMTRLISAAEAKNIQIRAIGGLAVQAHNTKNHPLFIREFADLDFVVAKKQRRDFEMCHKIPLEERLTFDPVTIPLAELLLSKTQIVELNRKDALDITSILLNNETGKDDRDKINLQILAHLCGQDWGLYKTTSINLDRVIDLVSEKDISLTKDDRELIIGRVHAIQKTFEEMQKPIAWQLRDRVGTRGR